MRQERDRSDSEGDDRRLVRFLASDIVQEEWVTCYGGGLTQPMQVKFEVRGGRVRVTGVKIDNESVVTAQTLREVRLAAIEAAIEAFLRDERQSVIEERSLAEDRSSRTSDPEALENARGRLEAIMAYEMKLDEAIARVTALQAANAGPFRSRGRGAQPPSEQDYLEFARLYLEKLVKNPRGAVSATAREAGMDRSTVYRWINACREPSRQYIPPKDKS